MTDESRAFDHDEASMRASAASIDLTDQRHPIGFTDQPAFSESSEPATYPPQGGLRTAAPKEALTVNLKVRGIHNVRNNLIKNRKWTSPPHFVNRLGLKVPATLGAHGPGKQRATSNAVDRAPAAYLGGELTKPAPEAPFVPEAARVISKIPLADVAVDVGQGVDTKNVEILADSFRRAGQTSAILVVREEEHGSFRVISGIHRVVAAKELGWDQIDAVVLDCDERDQRLIEIAEDLHRRELPALERAELTYEWIQLIHHEAMQDARPSGGRQPNDQGLSKAARALGVTKEETMRSARIASISPEGKSKARELGFHDNQAVLLQVAKMPTSDLQIARILEIGEGKKAPRRLGSKRRTHEAPQDEGSGSPSSASAASFQLHPPEQDWSLPKNLARRKVAEHLDRLKLKWSDFRLFLLDAPIAARRQFIQEVLMPDRLIQQNSQYGIQPNRATPENQGGGT